MNMFIFRYGKERLFINPRDLVSWKTYSYLHKDGLLPAIVIWYREGENTRETHLCGDIAMEALELLKLIMRPIFYGEEMPLWSEQEVIDWCEKNGWKHTLSPWYPKAKDGRDGFDNE